MDWNEETIGRLRQLWAEGHSTSEIARRMGASKNAIVGKAHRLNLASRPSPIRRGRTHVVKTLPIEVLAQIQDMAGRTGGAWMATHQIANLLRVEIIDIVDAVKQLIALGRLPSTAMREGVVRTNHRPRLRSIPLPTAAQPLAETASPARQHAPVTLAPPTIATSEALPDRPSPPSTIPKVTDGAASPPVGRCCWPMWGDREAPTHEYCGDPNLEGYQYCCDHSHTAYPHLRAKPAREAA